jgi:hypothetical protein
MKYHGLRWDNVAKKRTPNEDFGIFYFTSRPSLKKEFKKNKKNFIFELTYTFDSKKEAQTYETKFNKKILNKSEWLNQSAYPHLIHSEEGKERIRAAHLGSKQSAETIRRKIESITGLKRSKKTKDKMSKAQKALNKKISDETKEKMSNTIKEQYRSGKRKPHNKGKKLSKKTKDKISKSRKGKRAGKDSHWFGKKHSEITKKKMSASLKKSYKNPSKKRLLGIKVGAKKKIGQHYHTEESKKKISEAHLKNKYNLGRKVSKKTREKISKGNKGKKRSKKLKKQISESLKKYYKSKKTT